VKVEKKKGSEIDGEKKRIPQISKCGKRDKECEGEYQDEKKPLEYLRTEKNRPQKAEDGPPSKGPVGKIAKTAPRGEKEGVQREKPKASKAAKTTEWKKTLIERSHKKKKS